MSLLNRAIIILAIADFFLLCFLIGFFGAMFKWNPKRTPTITAKGDYIDNLKLNTAKVGVKNNLAINNMKFIKETEAPPEEEIDVPPEETEL